MTNPHLSLFRMPLQASVQHKLRACALVASLCMSFNGFCQTESAQELEWQPGQPAALPNAKVGTPHHHVQRLLRQAKYAQALVFVNNALTTNPRDPQMRFWQGFIYEQLGQPDMATQVYLELTREHPELAEPFNNLGVLYAAKGDYPSAREALDQALRANPHYATALENMGDLLTHMARQSYARALTIEAKRSGVAQKIERLSPAQNTTKNKP